MQGQGQGQGHGQGQVQVQGQGHGQGQGQGQIVGNYNHTSSHLQSAVTSRSVQCGVTTHLTPETIFFETKRFNNQVKTTQMILFYLTAVSR